jgi:hypothetical protein
VILWDALRVLLFSLSHTVSVGANHSSTLAQGGGRSGLWPLEVPAADLSSFTHDHHRVPPKRKPRN